MSHDALGPIHDYKQTTEIYDTSPMIKCIRSTDILLHSKFQPEWLSQHRYPKYNSSRVTMGTRTTKEEESSWRFKNDCWFKPGKGLFCLSFDHLSTLNRSRVMWPGAFKTRLREFLLVKMVSLPHSLGTLIRRASVTFRRLAARQGHMYRCQGNTRTQNPDPAFSS